jgi:hypothetical protein
MLKPYKKGTVFNQQYRVIFVYHIISPIVLVFDILVLIFNQNHDTISFAIGLTILNILLNFYNIVTTFSTITLTNDSLGIDYLFFKQRSKTIKRKSIVRVNFNDQSIVGLQPFMNIEVQYKHEDKIKKLHLNKGYMSYNDFSNLKSILLRTD